jgi:hypothetical protein
MAASSKPITMSHLIQIIRKYPKSLILLIVFTAVASTVFGVLYNKSAISGTIFINIGASQDQKTSLFETVEAADHMSEVVQGWFKDPSLLKKISDQAGHEANFNVRKQEKQNIVITFKTENTDQAKKVAVSLEENMRSALSRYNIETAGSFKITAFDSDYNESNIPVILFLLFGLVAGFMLSYALLSCWNIFLKEWHEYRR